MALSSAAVSSYGWRDAAPTCAHGYLWPQLQRILQAAGARTVLDLGCGNGALSQVMLAAGFAVTGCDADAEGIAIAQRHGRGRFVLASVYDDPASLQLEPVDAVVSAEVIEHLYAPAALARFAHAVLRPGGRLIVTTPYHGYLKNLAMSLANGWDRHWHPSRAGGHIKFFSRASLTRLLEEAGFAVEAFHGAGRAPLLWKSMILVARRA